MSSNRPVLRPVAPGSDVNARRAIKRPETFRQYLMQPQVFRSVGFGLIYISVALFFVYCFSLKNNPADYATSAKLAEQSVRVMADSIHFNRNDFALTSVELNSENERVFSYHTKKDVCDYYYRVHVPPADKVIGYPGTVGYGCDKTFTKSLTVHGTTNLAK